jgi:hypothetical protein
MTPLSLRGTTSKAVTIAVPCVFCRRKRLWKYILSLKFDLGGERKKLTRIYQNPQTELSLCGGQFSKLNELVVKFKLLINVYCNQLCGLSHKTLYPSDLYRGVVS